MYCILLSIIVMSMYISPYKYIYTAYIRIIIIIIIAAMFYFNQYSKNKISNMF